ncbi:predicted protein [Lichtheimia corymbifera JMRC:FSU:9682]|uniref:Uncharacterized protein n=1 Tax=Lichtheimia corymbifera JMRC:FSU:9682 TaxID=1263082 RepID=A0A068RMC8_9FUNG|nr:predicted protein [Lichtheimia corymbifera JMRC:FSU:9682]
MDAPHPINEACVTIRTQSYSKMVAKAFNQSININNNPMWLKQKKVVPDPENLDECVLATDTSWQTNPPTE